MKRLWFGISTITTLLAITGQAFPIVIKSGDFVSYVKSLEKLTFSANSNLYVTPSSAECSAFYTLACALRAGQIFSADVQAIALSYDLVKYIDTTTGLIYYGLCERLINDSLTRGWGYYFINFSFGADALIEIPHPRSDKNTPEIGAKVFRLSIARGFLMSGSHRNANGTGTADVTHLKNSIFQEVHRAWIGPNAQTIVWQIHGFKGTNNPGIPTGTDVVLSSGNGGVSIEILRLDQAFALWGFHSYTYNTLDPNVLLNVAVNEAYSGATFRNFGATTNVQGNYSRSLGGRFVHIELEQNIRLDATKLDRVTQLIAGIIASSEPHSLTLFVKNWLEIFTKQVVHPSK